MGFFDEIDYDDYEDVPIEDMLDEFGSVRTCPPTPLDGFSGGNLTSWIELLIDNGTRLVRDVISNVVYQLFR